MADIITAISAVFTGLFGILNAILVPATGLTPLATLAWFGLVAPGILFILAFVRRLARSGGD
jgi:hypothetical protein